ncbi:MAG: DegT/DnrJ/EryC1/StrS family aminotransferase [candidate division WOR-3 bacterium]
MSIATRPHAAAAHHISMLDLRREYQHMKQAIDDRIAATLKHQTWIMGPEVKELESRVARFIGTNHAIGCASGTDALVLALRALCLKLRGEEYFKREDEIITTAFTFAATGDAIVRAGATPVLVDIDPATFNISPERVAAALTPRTVGVVPVHLYGRACPMPELKALADRRKLFIVEDCAQSFGAAIGGRRCGAWGDAGAFSFFPSKNLGGFGDGGMVTTSDADLAELVDILRRHGGRDKYNVEFLGYNSRLDTLQAAVLLAKLDYIDDFTRRRQAVARRYTEELVAVPGIAVPKAAADSSHVFHQYTIRHTDRDRLAAALGTRGIATMVYYPVPLHSMKVFSERCLPGGPLTEAERAAAEVLSLPIEPLLEPDEVAQVARGVRECA